MEAPARLADIEATIEIRDCLAEREVAPRPRVRAREVTREEPFGRPLAEPADGDDARLHLLVRERRQRLQVEVGAREPHRVLRLAAREASRDEVLLARGGEHLARRELPDDAEPPAEALDHAVADRDGGEE